MSEAEHTARAWTSARLTVTSWSVEMDQPQLRASVGEALPSILTPAVLAHLPRSFALTGDTDAWIDARMRESAVYSVRDRHSAALLGLLILGESKTSGPVADVHLGYLLAEHAWGKGIASELLASFVKVMKRRGRWRVLGGVGKDNPASARVLETAGFRRDEALSSADTDIFTLML
jgi:GNAT superfamily N-acetyltransferase